MLSRRLASRLLAQDLRIAGPCSIRGFASGAQESSKGPDAWWTGEQWNEPKALYDEVVRRFENSPPPGRPAVMALLQRISKKEETTIAVDVVDRFRREKAAKGDFSGVGEMTTSFLINACLRVGDVAAASSALEKHVALGLKPTPVLAYRVVKAAARQGAEPTAAAYKAARTCGFALEPNVASEVVSGLSKGEGGGSQRALAAAEAFEKQNVKLGAAAWADVGVAAAGEGNAKVAAAMVEKAKAAGPGPRDTARVNLVAAQALLLEGGSADAAGAALAEAVKASAAAKAKRALNVGMLLQKWPSMLGKGDDSLKQRMAEAVAAAAAKGAKLECDVEAAFGGGGAAAASAPAAGQGDAAAGAEAASGKK